MNFALPPITSNGASHLAALNLFDARKGPDPGIVGGFNAQLTGSLGGRGSDRDPASLPDTNASVVIEATVDQRYNKMLDVNQHEIVFVWTKDRYTGQREPQTQGVYKPAQRQLGLSAFNEYLKSSEALMLYGGSTAAQLKEDWAILGVMQGKVKEGGSTAHTYYVDGRAVLPDITCWARGTGNSVGMQSHVCQAGDYISICLRRVTLVRENSKYLRDQDQTWHWVAVPVRHRGPTPSAVHYTSVGYMSSPSARFRGDYWPLGYVRMTLGINPINSTRVTEQCYNYLFNKQPNTDEHLRGYYDLPQIEVILHLRGRLT